MDNIKIAITKEQIAMLPPVIYDGGIQVVDTPEKARVALRELTRARIVGFATDDFCFLFRLNKLGFPDKLKDFISDPAITKIGLSVHDDFKSISRSCEIDPHGFIELQNYTKQFCIADNSLQKIFAIVFGRCISKSQRLTNWEAPELTPHQQNYAAVDAWACLKLYRCLSSGNFNPADSPYIVVDNPDIAVNA